MNAVQIRWWMEVFHRNVYIQLVVAFLGVIAGGVAFVFDKSPNRIAGFVFGIAALIIGVVSCYASATMYDRLTAKLRYAESEEKKQKKKEEKHARKPKTN